MYHFLAVEKSRRAIPGFEPTLPPRRDSCRRFARPAKQERISTTNGEQLSSVTFWQSSLTCEHTPFLTVQGAFRGMRTKRQRSLKQERLGRCRRITLRMSCLKGRIFGGSVATNSSRWMGTLWAGNTQDFISGFNLVRILSGRLLNLSHSKRDLISSNLT